MRYIFEDNEMDPMVKLYNSMYTKEIVSKFIYTRGNGALIGTIESLVGIEDEVYIFMDLVPGNKDTIEIYNALRRFKNKFKTYVIFPIICREYYFVKSLMDTQIVDNKHWVLECVNLDWYGDSSIISSDRDRKFCTSIEKFCKLVVRKAFKECIKRDDTGEIEFFSVSCKCNKSNTKCGQEISKESKLNGILASFECFPKGSRLKRKVELTTEDCMEIHRYLIDRYNEVCRRYKEKDNNPRHKYMRAKYL